MDILFLSHCAPNPPNKGEKVRAFHEISRLAKDYRVHLVAFARFESECADTLRLRDRCESVYIETRGFKSGLLRGGLAFAMGGGLNLGFYHSRSMRAYIRKLCAKVKVSAVVAYSLPMVPYAPPGLPLIFDMVDVDSGKWAEYSKSRRPGFLYSLEAGRLRRSEATFAANADITFLTTEQEVDQLRKLSPSANARCMENGVNFDYFDPGLVAMPPALKSRRFVAFVGTMDYYPNVEAAKWFAQNVFPALRRTDPGLEFFVVGNHPSREARELGRHPGVVVTGGVPDVRPYFLFADSIVAPLHIAHGVQNKVLEALAMGRTVFTTSQVCLAFAGALPEGLVPCDTSQEYVSAIQGHVAQRGKSNDDIRAAMRSRFAWDRSLRQLKASVEELTKDPASTSPERAALDI